MKNKKYSCFYLLTSWPYACLWLAIIVIATLLRLWELGSIDLPVFDEVYFPKYGLNYLQGKEFFHVHPPLVNYIFAFSIWVYYHLPWTESANINQLSFDQLAAVSVRWINVCFGTLLIIVAWGCAYALTLKRWYALLVMLLICLEGTLLVDSRYALNNIYIVLFGLSAVLCAAKSTHYQHNKALWLSLCGLFLGLTVSVKWSGLGFWLAIVGFCILVKIRYLFDYYRPVTPGQPTNEINSNINLLTLSWYLIGIPILVYCIVWIPDRLFNTEHGFIGIHQQIFSYHSQLVGTDEHPYCSKWYQWPFMIRPISYSFAAENAHFKDVHLFANPVLLWLSTLSIFIMIGHWLVNVKHWFTTGKTSRFFALSTLLLCGYFANLLPWALISRCLFQYHYESAATFAVFILAWYLYIGWRYHKTAKLLSGSLILLIVISFVYWLPILLGIPLSAESFYGRMWFQSWI